MAVIGWFIARSLKWTSLNEVYVRLAVGLSVFVLTGVTARGMGRE